VFTDPRVLALVLAAAVAVALYRRQWCLAVVMVVSPPVAVVLVELLKRLFDRQKGGALAYPSGHTTAAVAAVVIGMLGQAVTYHYFTDTVGGLLLGTAIVCVAAQIARLDTCQPRVRSASQRGLA
jgi:membrane-associated phospholipid phosphatase